MGRSLVVPQAGETLVRVASFDKVVTLQSNLSVAEYHTVSGVSGSATPTEIGGAQCSVIERSIEDDKQESTERVERQK